MSCAAAIAARCAVTGWRAGAERCAQPARQIAASAPAAPLKRSHKASPTSATNPTTQHG